MSIRGVLFSNLSPAETQFLKDKWGSNEEFEGIDSSESYYFRRLIDLFNNGAGLLEDIIDKNEFYRLLNYLNLRPSAPSILIKEISQLKSLIEKEINEIPRKSESHEVNARLLYSKMLLNVIKVIEGQSEKWQAAYEDIKAIRRFNLSDFFEYHSDKFLLEVDFSSLKPIPTGKPWLDIRTADNYFQQNDLASLTEKINSLRTLSDENKKKLITALIKKNESILPKDKCPKLQEAIVAYHKIAKSEGKNITKRRKALLHISELSEMLLTDPSFTPSQKETLSEIQQQAKMKARYLAELSFIPHLTAKRMFRFEQVRRIPLIVDKPDWFGDLDPLHRKRGEHYERWQAEMREAEAEEEEEELAQNKPFPDFWLWMERQPESILTTMKIDERYTIPIPEKLVTFKEGVCYNRFCSTREDGRIDDGIYLYNIGKDNKLYILPTPQNFWTMIRGEKFSGGVKSNIAFNHNSVLHGAGVQCAGCVAFQNGKIILIDTNSGHYRPYMTNLQNVIREVLEPARVFTKDAVVTDYNAMAFIPVPAFIEESFDLPKTFPQSLPRYIELTPEQVEKAYGLDVDRMHDAIQQKREEFSKSDRKLKSETKEKARGILREYVRSAKGKGQSGSDEKKRVAEQAQRKEGKKKKKQ